MISNESPNKIIPKLLKCSKEYTSHMNNRLKVNTIFSEFDQTANNTFNKFINLSNARYKSVKYGNSLDSILSHQKPTYKNIATEINEKDVFINNSEIEEEKKKLLINTGTKQVKQLNNLREQLRNTTKDLSQYEKLKREKLNLKIAQKRMKTFNPQKQKISSSYKKNKNKQQIPIETKQLEENEIFIKNLIDQDKKYINRNMNRYYKYLDLLHESTSPGKKHPIKKEILNKMPSSHVLPEYMNFLNYKEEKPIIIFTKKKVNKDIDLNKLIKFTKNKKVKLSITSPDNEMLISRNKSEDKKTIPINEINDESKYNTINIIKNKANQSLCLNNNFLKRKNKIHKQIEMNLPNVEEYEEHSNQTETNMNKTKRNLGAQFNVIYNIKKSKWNEEDKQIEQTNNIKHKKMLENFEFLQAVKKSNRLNQLYVDGYSIRDNTINSNIKEFNKMMGSHSYFNKKGINIRLNMYISAKEKKEKLNKVKSEENELKYLDYNNLNQKKINLINNMKESIEITGSEEADTVTISSIGRAKKRGSKSQEYKEEEYKAFLKRKEDYVTYLKERKEMNKGRENDFVWLEKMGFGGNNGL